MILTPPAADTSTPPGVPGLPPPGEVPGESLAGEDCGVEFAMVQGVKYTLTMPCTVESSEWVDQYHVRCSEMVDSLEGSSNVML